MRRHSVNPAPSCSVASLSAIAANSNRLALVSQLCCFAAQFTLLLPVGAAPRHPQWYVNLLADPEVTVEDGAQTWTARAVVLEGAERDAAFARAVAEDPGWGTYQEQTTRTLPVVVLERR